MERLQADSSGSGEIRAALAMASFVWSTAQNTGREWCVSLQSGPERAVADMHIKRVSPTGLCGRPGCQQVTESIFESAVSREVECGVMFFELQVFDLPSLGDRRGGCIGATNLDSSEHPIIEAIAITVGVDRPPVPKRTSRPRKPRDGRRRALRMRLPGVPGLVTSAFGGTVCLWTVRRARISAMVTVGPGDVRISVSHRTRLTLISINPYVDPDSPQRPVACTHVMTP